MARKPDHQTQGPSTSAASGQQPRQVADEANRVVQGDIGAGKPVPKESDPEALTKLETENAELKDRLLRALVSELLKNATLAGGFFALATVGAGANSVFGDAPPGLFAYLP